MKKFLLVFGLMFFSYTSFAAITITAPTSVSGDYNTQEDVNVQISSDIEDDVFRIRLIGGLTSADDINCVKSFTAAESCSFTVSHTVLQKKSTRIYVYAKDGGRAQHTILFDVAPASTRADLSTGIEFFGHLVSGGQVDFGTLQVVSTNQTRVYVKNTGDQKTSAIDSITSNYSGSTAFSVVRGTCQGKELAKDETCYFDVRVDLSSVIEGVQTGTVLVKAAGETVGSSIDITGDLSLATVSGGGTVTIGTGGPGGTNSNVNTVAFGESFTNSEDFLLQEIDLYMGLNASSISSGDIKVEIGVLDAALQGGTIGSNLSLTATYPGTIIGESATLDATTLGLVNGGSDLVTFTFPDISLTANTEYFFVITHTAGNNVLRLNFTDTDTYPEGSQLSNGGGGSTWYKLNTYTGATNQKDVAFTIRGATAGGGSGPDLSSVDYFCTQAGVDESGYTSPPFCSAAGEPVETQYIPDCFTHPTWCSLNSQSENSVIARTSGDIVGTRKHTIRLTSQDINGSFYPGFIPKLRSSVRVTFYSRAESFQDNPALALSSFFMNNTFGTLESLYLTPIEEADLNNISAPFQRASFRVRFYRRTASDLVIISALDANSTDSYNTGTREFDLDEGDLLLTDAQLYEKYEDNILACFAAGGDLVRIEKDQDRDVGNIDQGTPHGTPTTVRFLGTCAEDVYYASPGQIEGNSHESHGYEVAGISTDNAYLQVFGVNRSNFTNFEDYDAYTIPIVDDFLSPSRDLTESAILKYNQLDAYYDNL